MPRPSKIDIPTKINRDSTLRFKEPPVSHPAEERIVKDGFMTLLELGLESGSE
jgi:hypothetical protein